MEAPAFEDIDPGDDCDCPACGRGPLSRPAVSRGRPGPPAGRVLAVVASTAAATGAALGAAPPPRPPRTPLPVPPTGRPSPRRTSPAPAGRHGTPARPRRRPGPARHGCEDPADDPRRDHQTGQGVGRRAGPVQHGRVLVGRVPPGLLRLRLDGLGPAGQRVDGQPRPVRRQDRQGGPPARRHPALPQPREPAEGLTRRDLRRLDGLHPHLLRRLRADPAGHPPQDHPYVYWSHSGQYVPYRYKGVTAGTAGAEAGAGGGQAAYPGRSFFGPGADNAYVTRLGQMLAARGGASFYRSGPGPRWGDADRRATEAFQRAQGWRGENADGVPGPRTWSLLVSGGGRDIASAATGTPDPSPAPGAPAFPGKAMFRPGADNAHVTQLGRRLVEKGFGTHYTSGPGPRWGEADRRNVEAFQRAQGWRGGAADGYPGPETWRRLFL
ncbi:peptidoglycan-binding protein [Streptomyces galbus]|uniref:peptidoglycan-binding protein n=1 Tax=Streptomyces galbus TaxID=33898 RepID=UPI003EBB8D93